MEKNKSFYIDKKVNWVYIFLITLSLTYYVAFIHSLDRPDFDNYTILFNRISKNLFDSKSSFLALTKNSFGFYFYIKFIKQFTNDFRLFIGITAFISIFIKIFLISKTTKNLYFSTFIYFLLVFPIHELVQIRLGLSTSLFFLAIYLFNKKSYLLTIILFAGSVSIHLVSLALAIGALIIKSILFLVKEKKIPLKINPAAFLGFLTFCIFALIRFASLSANLTYYFNETEVSTNIFSVRNSLLFLMIFIGITGFDKFPNYAKDYFCISIIGVSAWYIFQSNFNIASRLHQSVYFSFIVWIDYMPRNLYLILRYLLLIVSLVFIYLKRSWFIQ